MCKGGPCKIKIVQQEISSCLCHQKTTHKSYVKERIVFQFEDLIYEIISFTKPVVAEAAQADDENNFQIHVFILQSKGQLLFAC